MNPKVRSGSNFEGAGDFADRAASARLHRIRGGGILAPNPSRPNAKSRPLTMARLGIPGAGRSLAREGRRGTKRAAAAEEPGKKKKAAPVLRHREGRPGARRRPQGPPRPGPRAPPRQPGRGPRPARHDQVSSRRGHRQGAPASCSAGSCSPPEARPSSRRSRPTPCRRSSERPRSARSPRCGGASSGTSAGSRSPTSTRPRSGSLLSRVMTDAEGIRNLVGTGLVEVVGGLVTAVARARDPLLPEREADGRSRCRSSRSSASSCSTPSRRCGRSSASARRSTPRSRAG